jgi:hypothetical protein
MKIFRTSWLEATVQYCAGEFGIGFWLTILDGHHLTASVHIGPFDAGLDVWFPMPVEVAE